MQADDLAMIVFNACLFTAAAVSGMRSSELMELTTRSCLPPRQSGQGLFRYALASRRIKGEPLGGAADEWVVIEPAYRAVELATRLSGAKTALAGTEPGTSVFGRYAFTTRFNTFRRWVNSAAGARLGLSPIPEEQVTARMVRRTLALELAHRPHGLLAAKVQEIADLSAFKTTALSRLAAQHQEITALRAALANRANVRTLPATLNPPDSQQ
jgi:hypothetical protein